LYQITNLASQLKGLSADKLAALFTHTNINIVKQEGKRNYNKMQQFPARPRQGQGGVSMLPSGLQLCSSSCTGSKLGNVKVVIPKTYRRNTLHNQQKTKKIVTSPLSSAIAGSNITKILSITNIESYDIAEDASQWHTSIKDIHGHIIQYDIMAIYCVPVKFSTSDVNSVTTFPGFVNAILDWKNLKDEDCFHWQEFLHLFGPNVNIKSDQWMEEFLHKLMEKTLKDKVMSDFNELPKERCGAISLYHCMVNRMATKNKESHRNLEQWLQTCRLSWQKVHKDQSLHQGYHKFYWP
jgi:hypothetical protein